MKSGATPAQMWSQVPTDNKIVSVIKSIQRGVILLDETTSNTATITSVDVDKSVVLFGGTFMDQNAGSMMAYLVLTNSTTVTLLRFTNYESTTVSWQVIEYY